MGDMSGDDGNERQDISGNDGSERGDISVDDARSGFRSQETSYSSFYSCGESVDGD